VRKICFFLFFRLEDESEFEQAMKLYKKSISVIPYHKEAVESLRYLENKLKTTGFRKAPEQEEMNLSVDTSGLLMPGKLKHQ
jgi:hypothetical protein